MACPCRRQAEHLLRIFIAWSTRRSFTGRPGRAPALTDRRPPVEAGIDERALCDDRAYSPARRSLPLGGLWKEPGVGRTRQPRLAFSREAPWGGQHGAPGQRLERASRAANGCTAGGGLSGSLGPNRVAHADGAPSGGAVRCLRVRAAATRDAWSTARARRRTSRTA